MVAPSNLNFVQLVGENILSSYGKFQKDKRIAYMGHKLCFFKDCSFPKAAYL